VAAAKRQVFGTVGIDMIAGPSEVLVMADGDNNPDWIAADLLAQAEHDAGAQSILMTRDEAFGEPVIEAVERPVSTLRRAETARRSWAISAPSSSCRTGRQRCRSPTALPPNIWKSPPMMPRSLAARIRNAGAIFIGRHTPEVIGDYVGGSNHVLPTARSARFSSGLSVLDYVKRTSILKLGPEQLQSLGPAAITLARPRGSMPMRARSRSG
jgi:histidinol dehydrogenase